MTFKPPPPEKPEYASYIPSRSPQFKIHRKLGQARQAIRLNVWGKPRGGIIYKWDDEKNDWVEFESEPLETCVYCGGIDEGYPKKLTHNYKSNDAYHYQCKKEAEEEAAKKAKAEEEAEFEPGIPFWIARGGEVKKGHLK